MQKPSEETTEQWARRAAALQRAIQARGPLEDTIFPVPIRNGTITVRIQGLPFDLTPAEANKIAAVILAYAEKSNG
jgi:hypothetical protein